MSNSQGITTLLDAEKEAQKIVVKAREYRNARVKDARGEAAKEIEALKAKREAEFKKSQSKHSGDADANQEEIDKATKEELDQLKRSYESNRASVVDELLSRVIEVSPSLHRNFKAPA